ncbi:MAG: hypothetical protein R2710_04745 [Acidimicrobiales bacterium]
MTTLGRIDFEPPRPRRLPLSRSCVRCGRLGGTAPAWLSAANEVAVDAFLQGRIRWVDIADVNEVVLSMHDGGNGLTLDGVLDGDAAARAHAAAIVAGKEHA